MSKLKSIEELFEGRHFDREVIIVCVRWYLRFKLSLRDLVEMMAVLPVPITLLETCQSRWAVRQLTSECTVLGQLPTVVERRSTSPFRLDPAARRRARGERVDL